MKRILFALVILILHSLPVEAAVNRCLGPDGGVIYTNQPCPQGVTPGPAGASTSHLSDATDPGRSSEGSTFLWSVKGTRNTVYILGTLHLATANLYPLDEAVEKAYRESAVVVFEVDPGDRDSSAHQSTLLSNGLYLDGTTLKDHLSPSVFQLLSEKARAVGLPSSQLRTFKPWLCALTVTAVTLQRLGFDPKYGLDRHFLSRSKRDGKPRIFLESADFQLTLLTELEGRMQESFLEKTLNDLDGLENLYSTLLRSWKAGKADEVGSLLEKSFDQYPAIYDRFVLQRNRQWIGRVEDFLGGEDDIFVVVGAGHLTGEEGLIARLRAGGYAVTQK